MSEMIERVARVLEPFGWSWLDTPQDHRGFVAMREISMEKARAAVAAMREPTEAVVKAGFHANVWTNSGNVAVGRVTLSPIPAWQAMIDEALK